MTVDNENLVPYCENGYGVIFLLFLSLRLAGLVGLLLNAMYLECNKVLNCFRTPSITDTLPERCCKIRNSFACNVFILYHAILLATEAIAAFVCVSPPISSRSMAWHFWVLVLWDYLLLSAFTFIGDLTGTGRSHAHVGCVHALNIFECVNLVIYWMMVVLLASFLARSYLPDPLKGLASGYGVIPLVISYMAMLFGAYKNYDSFNIHKKVISKSEAVEKMNKQIEDKPRIEWHFKCRVYGEDGQAITIESCRETKSYVFRSSNVETKTNLVPSEDIFQKTYTKLNIQESVRIGDRYTQEECAAQRQHFLAPHSGHHTSKVESRSHSSVSFLVGNVDTIPSMFKPKFYYIFTLLGLSLPHRWYVYLKTGHIKFKVNKRVFQAEAVPLETTVTPIVSQTPEIIIPPLTSPGTGIAQEVEVPPDYSSGARSETPPPDYETVRSEGTPRPLL